MQYIPPADDDAWFSAEGQIDGRLSLLRIRPEMRAYVGHSLFSKLLTVSWDYGDDEESGMPDGDDVEMMRKLEDRLVAELESENLGTLTFVTTERGVRTWYFYVNGAGPLKDAINGALADLPQLPIELRVASDPEWTTFSSYAAALGDA